MDFDHLRIHARSVANYLDRSFDLTNYSLGNETRSTPSSEEEEPFYKEFVDYRLVVGIWEMVLCVIGAPMNAFVIYMARNIIGKMDQQDNQHLCILSMAIADLFFACTHCPLMFINYVFIDFGVEICKFLFYVTHLATVASSLSLLCLNVDKFVSLRSPLRYQTILTYQRTKMCLATSWLLSVAWATFFVFGPLTAFEHQCQVYTVEPHAYASFFILFFVLPITFSLCISLYVLTVAIEARRTEYRRVSTGTSSTPRQSKVSENILSESDHLSTNGKRRSNAPSFYSGTQENGHVVNGPEGEPSQKPVSRLKTVTFVFSTTLWSSLTFIPYRTAYLAYHFNPENWLARISFGLFALMISNAAGNPFITVITQHQYRGKVKKFLKKRDSHVGAQMEKMNGVLSHGSAHSMVTLCARDERESRQGEKLLQRFAKDAFN